MLTESGCCNEVTSCERTIMPASLLRQSVVRRMFQDDRSGKVEELKLSEQSHRRFNPLTNEWVLVSPHRTQRPWQGAMESVPAVERPQYDPTCYLCPGN